MRGIPGLLLLLASLPLAVYGAEPQVIETEEQSFSQAVAVDGDVIAVGAPRADIGDAFDQGRVHVYEPGENGWVEVAVLAASDGAANARFGESLALDGNLLMVGAPFASVNGLLEAGAVYAFERDEYGDWNEVAKLVAADPTTMARFGSDVSMEGDELIVAAPRADEELGQASGAAYVFARGDGGWQQSAKLDREQSEEIASSVAIANGRAVLGWHSTGLAYQRTESGWEFVQAVHGTDDDIKLEMDGDVLVAAEPEASSADTSGPMVGHVLVFEATASGWDHVAMLESAMPSALNQFGFASDINDGVIAATNGYEYGGRIALFMKDETGDWNRIHEIRNETPTFEKSLAVSRQTLVYGIPQPFGGEIAIYDLAGIVPPIENDDSDDDGQDDDGQNDDGDDSGGDGDGGDDNGGGGFADDDPDTGDDDSGDNGSDEDGSGDSTGDDTASGGDGTDDPEPAGDSGGGAPGWLLGALALLLLRDRRAVR